MGLLKEAIERAIRGQGGLVFLCGETGIGKTRLARELGAYAGSRGVRVLHGRCSALFRMNGVPPYALWNEVIKDYLEASSPEQLYMAVGPYSAEVAKLVPELKLKLGAIPRSLPISPKHERDRLFEAVSQFITRISKESPLLVVLDDLQWADQTSLLLLHYLARGIYKRPLLLLGAYRETDIDEKHPLAPVLTELNRERLLQSVPLNRMSFNAVSEMIRQILEQRDVPKEFCELVYEKTRGNPFFVEEVMKSLKEAGVIFREADQWSFKEASKIEFPPTVKGVIKARIDRLDDECQNLLTLASFVGNDFSFEALCGVTGIEQNKLLELMERLLKTGLVKEMVIRGEDVYSFADVIVRDVVHEEVSHLRHKKLHNSVGNALEKVYADNIDQHLGELAYHYLESGDKDKALDYFSKAGEKAQKVYAHNEAFSYLQHALELLEEKEAAPGKKASVIERLGDLKAWMGETDAGMKYWNKSLALWNQLRDKKSVAALHVKMANLLWDSFGDKEKASEHHNAALEILEKEPESAELARLYENISHMLWRTGETAKASSLAEKALKLAERFNDAETLAESCNDLATLSQKPEEALKYCERGLEAAVENNCIETALRLYNNISLYYEALGNGQKMVEMLQEGYELAKKAGETFGRSWIGRNLAYCYLNMGEMQKALAMLEELLEFAKRTKNTVGIIQATYRIGRIYRYMGEWDQSLQYLREAYDIAIKTTEYHTIAEAAVDLGGLFMETEEYTEAEKYLNEANNTSEKAGDIMYQVSDVLPMLAELYLRKGETERAKQLIKRMYERAKKAEFKPDATSTEMLEGMLCREQRNWEQSIRHFEKSLAESKSVNKQKWYVYQYAQLLYEYGSMYLERNEEGDKERAFSLLNQALDIYQKNGANKRADKTRSRMTCEEAAHEAALKPEPVAEVPGGVLRRIPTGYRDLDRLLCGGIPENYAVVLTAPACDERGLLIKSFLETAAEKGEASFYITTDPHEVKTLIEEFQSNFYVFICNPQADAITKGLPNVVKLKGVENLTEISIALTSVIRKLDRSLKHQGRVCIEILSDVLLQHHAVQTRRWLTALIPELRSTGFTTLAVIDPQMHPSEELHAILGLFEGEISIYERETEKGLGKFVKIRKMSNQKYLESELLLKKEELQK
jgi:tetratricopeptide (TPR) repeat protein